MTTETQAAFARRIGKDRSHVTRLKQAGRLVMRDGRIVVEDSLERLKATESPLPRDAANRERLAEAREQKPATDETLVAAAQRQKLAQADKMENEAAIAKLERQRIEGSLVALDDVAHGAASVSATVRTTLESIPDRYAPEWSAVSDSAQLRALIEEAVEIALGTMDQGIDAVIKGLQK